MKKRLQGKSKTPAKRRSSAYIDLPRFGLILLVIVVLVLGSCTWVMTRHSHANQPNTAETSSLTSFTCNSGPWGQVECVEIVNVDMPDEAITDNYLTRAPLRWYFPHYSLTELSYLFSSAGLSHDEFAPLLDGASPDPAGAGFVLHPSNPFILNLSPEARAAINSRLAADPRNDRQAEPFHFPAEHMDAWFKQSGLPDATVDLIRRLLYRRGDVMLFSSLDVVLDTLPDRAEKVRLIKTLGRTPTLLMNLHVSPASNIGQLVEYWGVNGRGKELRPLLEAMAQSPAGSVIGSAQLLPPFARKRLYTYPMEADWDKQTCYWTAMNFFNEAPDDGFENLQYTAKAIAAHYTPIERSVSHLDRSKARFGDLILLMKSADDALHACNYVADGIVFTKNGPGRSSPWILMKLDDVLHLYGSNQGTPPLSLYRLNAH